MDDDAPMNWPEDPPAEPVKPSKAEPSKVDDRTPEQIANDAAATRFAKGCGIGCLTMIGLVVVALIYSSFVGDSEGSDVPADPLYYERGVVGELCKSAVLAQLKAPSTAKLGRMQWANDGHDWAFRGTVDAENSFGAMLRTGWSCTATYADGEATDLVAKLDE